MLSSLTKAEDLLTADGHVLDIIRNRLNDYHTVDDLTGCWNWTKSVFKSNGRARMALGKKSVLASRVSYVIFKGDTNGLCVLHTCDNVRCINPDHLWLGTNADNSNDMVSKGRSLCQLGELNHSASLNEDIVIDIKLRLAKGQKQNEIARCLGLHKSNVNLIATGKRWSHVVLGDQPTLFMES